MIDLGRSCSRHRPLLVDFVDRGEVQPGTVAALRHLDGCGRCTEAIESTLLTITALRRLGDEVRRAEPSPDAWPRLRLRITRWPRRPAVMSPLAGIAMSFAIVAVLALPYRLGGGSLFDQIATPSPAGASHADLVDQQIEASYVAGSRRLASSASSVSSLPRNIPQEIVQARKEVHSAEPSGRPLEPI